MQLDIGTSDPIRNAHRDEIGSLARLWFDGWHEAHGMLVPDTLRRVRTVESFIARLHADLVRVRTVGPLGSPVGLAMTRDDELDQLFVAPSWRGRGIAARFVQDALRRIRDDGHATAWLICMIGNLRAARFYERVGWQRAGVVPLNVATADGPAELDVWRYEIAL